MPNRPKKNSLSAGSQQRKKCAPEETCSSEEINVSDFAAAGTADVKPKVKQSRPTAPLPGETRTHSSVPQHASPEGEEPTPAAASEYVSPSQPLEEKPAGRRSTKPQKKTTPPPPAPQAERTAHQD